MQYTFGDSDLAARRLEVLARVFQDSTREFLLRAAPRSPARAGDLGCGPGLTTRLIAETLRPADVIGLDSSERFIELARERAPARMEFRLHNVAQSPFPDAPYDLLFCRFLIAHLKDPASLVHLWGSQLGPGGRLLIEEVEWIKTSIPPFSRYLEIVGAMLQSQGTELHVGPVLDALEIENLKKTSTEIRRLKVADRDAATMFSLNIATWKSNVFILGNYATSDIVALEAELNRLRDSPASASGIEWGLRQIALERT